MTRIGNYVCSLSIASRPRWAGLGPSYALCRPSVGIRRYRIAVPVESWQAKQSGRLKHPSPACWASGSRQRGVAVPLSWLVCRYNAELMQHTKQTPKSRMFRHLQTKIRRNEDHPASFRARPPPNADCCAPLGQ